MKALSIGIIHPSHGNPLYNRTIKATMENGDEKIYPISSEGNVTIRTGETGYYYRFNALHENALNLLNRGLNYVGVI